MPPGAWQERRTNFQQDQHQTAHLAGYLTIHVYRVSDSVQRKNKSTKSAFFRWLKPTSGYLVNQLRCPGGFGPPIPCHSNLCLLRVNIYSPDPRLE
jgi:hypothetical protein